MSYSITASLAALGILCGHLSVAAQVAAPTARALVRPGNDFGADGDSVGRVVTVPSAVAARIDSIAHAAYIWACSPPPSCGNLPLHLFYGPIFRITAPLDQVLYVFHEPAPWGGWYYFILADTLNKRVVTEPIRIDGRWMEREQLRHPSLRFEVLGDGDSPRVVIEEPFHEGTDDTGWFYHYYSIDTLGLFHPMLTAEWNLIDQVVGRWLMDSTWGGGDALITRNLTSLGPGRLRLDARIQGSKRSVELGYAILAQARPGTPFTIVESHPTNGRWNDVLLSLVSSPAAREHLLRGESR